MPYPLWWFILWTFKYHSVSVLFVIHWYQQLFSLSHGGLQSIVVFCILAMVKSCATFNKCNNNSWTNKAIKDTGLSVFRWAFTLASWKALLHLCKRGSNNNPNWNNSSGPLESLCLETVLLQVIGYFVHLKISYYWVWMYFSDYYFKGGDEFLPTPVFRPPPKLPASRVSLGTSVISVGSSFSKYT